MDPKYEETLARAIGITREVLPRAKPEFTCMVVAAAIAGQLGLKTGAIRIGALFDLSSDTMTGGWGCASYSPFDQQLFLAEEEIDEADGGFNGHTWLEPDKEVVVDLMHGVVGAPRRQYADDDRWKIVRAYIPRPKLERLVKAFWRPQIRQAMALGRKSRTATEVWREKLKGQAQ